MADLPTREELFRIGAAEVLATNDEVQLSAVVAEGSDANRMVAAMAAMGEEVVAQLGVVLANGFLESAQGAALVKRGWDRHQILPKPAAPPFVDLSFFLSAPATTGFTVPAGTTVQSADGKIYETIADLPFAVGAEDGTVIARSQIAGTDQVVGPNKLRSITSTVVGATGLQVTNLAASSHGDDAEPPDDYRRRCRNEPAARVRGTRTAIVNGARAVDGVVGASAFEGIDTMGRANRICGVVVTGRFTDALVRQGGSVPSYELQSQALARLVETSLDDVRAFGIHVSATVAQVVMLAFGVRLRFRAGTDTNRARLMATATIVRHVNGLDPGETMDPADLVEALRAVVGLDIRGDEFDNPVGPVIPSSPYQVLRTMASLVSFSSPVSTTATAFSTISAPSVS